MIYRYFLPFCSLSFHFVDEFLSVLELLGWYSSTCLVLLSLPLLSDVISRKSSPGLRTRSLQPVFSVRSFMVSGCKSSVHSESGFYFTWCLSAYVFTTLPSLSESLSGYWLCSSFPDVLREHLQSFFQSGKLRFCLSVLVFWRSFPLWFRFYNLQLFSFCILEIWNCCFLASTVAPEKPILSVASLVTF